MKLRKDFKPGARGVSLYRRTLIWGTVCGIRLALFAEFVLVFAMVGLERCGMATVTELRLSPTNMAGSGVIVKVLDGKEGAKRFRVIGTPVATAKTNVWWSRLLLSDGKKTVLDCRVAAEALPRSSKEVSEAMKPQSAVFEFEVAPAYFQHSKFHLMWHGPVWTSVFVWTLYLNDFVAHEPAVSAEKGDLQHNPKAVLKKSAAIARVLQLTGFETSPTNIVAERLTSPLPEDQIPFLWGQYSNKPVWRVKLTNVGFNLKSPAVSVPGPYRNLRTFTAVVEAETGQLICVKCKYAGSVPDIRPEASAAVQEKALQMNETYTDFPSDDPTISLVHALDAVPTNPRLAKEIDALYVLESRMGAAPRPVWMVTLRGIPPIEPRSTSSAGIHPWLLNRMRCAVDARTGKLLFSTNTPYPETAGK